MSRLPRLVINGIPHHAVQRGNRKEKIFLSDSDYRHYAYLWNKCSAENKLSTIAYSFMPNHVHFVVVPWEEEALSKTFQICQVRYSKYFNKRYNNVGHLWHSRFFSTPMDERYCYEAVRYVETNPVRANLVKSPEMWNWSSTAFHLGKAISVINLVDINAWVEVEDWREYLSENLNEKIVKRIRNNSLNGRPSGGTEFIKKIELILGTKLKAGNKEK